MPASGGVRLVLVAADPSGQPSAAAPAAPLPSVPAQPGEVVLGERLPVRLRDGRRRPQRLLHPADSQRRPAPVQPGKPLVFELPEDARGAGLLEGSSPQAKVAGRRVEIAGPFRPGDTIVQFALLGPVRRREPDDRAAAAGAADAPGRGRGEGRRDAVELAADARAADDAGQRQALHRGPRRRGGGRSDAHVHVRGAAASPHVAAQRGARARVPDPRRRRVVDRARREHAGRRRGSTAGARGQARPSVRRARRPRRRAAAGHSSIPSSYAMRRRELVAALEQVYAALDDEVAVSRAS